MPLKFDRFWHRFLVDFGGVLGGQRRPTQDETQTGLDAILGRSQRASKSDLKRNPLQSLIYDRLGFDLGGFWDGFWGVSSLIFQGFGKRFSMDFAKYGLIKSKTNAPKGRPTTTVGHAHMLCNTCSDSSRFPFPF